MLRIKRVYDPPAAADGTRILIDGLWPRGLTKARAKVDLWLREIAPSADLRRWFGHDPERWPEFRARYRDELAAKSDAVKILRDTIKSGDVTLVFGARDAEHNNAVVIAEYLERRAPRRRTGPARATHAHP